MGFLRQVVRVALSYACASLFVRVITSIFGVSVHQFLFYVLFCLVVYWFPWPRISEQSTGPEEWIIGGDGKCVSLFSASKYIGFKLIDSHDNERVYQSEQGELITTKIVEKTPGTGRTLDRAVSWLAIVAAFVFVVLFLKDIFFVNTDTIVNGVQTTASVETTTTATITTTTETTMASLFSCDDGMPCIDHSVFGKSYYQLNQLYDVYFSDLITFSMDRLGTDSYCTATFQDYTFYLLFKEDECIGVQIMDTIHDLDYLESICINRYGVSSGYYSDPDAGYYWTVEDLVISVWWESSNQCCYIEYVKL